MSVSNVYVTTEKQTRKNDSNLTKNKFRKLDRMETKK